MLNPAWVIVSARAPHEYGPGFAWFHINFENAELRYDLDEIAASRDLRERFDGGREVSLGPPDEFCLFGGVLFGQLSCYPTSVELKSKRNNDRKHA